MPSSSEAAELIRAAIAAWAERWDLPELPSQVTVSFSKRLTASLGRCRPETGRVTLNAGLLDSADGLLAEVLCHEVAHVAVARLGHAGRPHGREWQRLVRLAGFAPRVRAAGPRPRVTATARRYFYEHRCPVCHAVRFARRPVPSWLCAACVDNGLAGELVITRIDATS